MPFVLAQNKTSQHPQSHVSDFDNRPFYLFVEDERRGARQAGEKPSSPPTAVPTVELKPTGAPTAVPTTELKPTGVPTSERKPTAAPTTQEL